MRASPSKLLSAARPLLASSSRRQASEVGLAAASLLPPLPLYTRILRSHRSLPIEMRSLGDAYVKDEFRKHRDVENPLQIVGFLTQWKLYLEGLETQIGLQHRGKPLDVQQFEKVSMGGGHRPLMRDSKRLLTCPVSCRTSNFTNYTN